MVNPHIVVTRNGRVAGIEISRREKKNAINLDMYGALCTALDLAQTDPEVGAVLLRGQPDLFTAGNDLGEFLTSAKRQGGPGHRFVRMLSEFPKPIVAAVGGSAIGIGTTMLLHCDVVVASDRARFRLPFVNLGLCPEAGSSLLLPQLAGHRLTAELMLLGDFFDAETAQRAGIVNRIVAADDLCDHALGLARRLASQPVDAITTTKALLKRPQGRSVRDAIEEEFPHLDRLLASDEARAIIRSLLRA